MNRTLKLKAVWISTDGGTKWLCVHQYYLTDAESRTLLNNTLEGKNYVMTEKKNEQHITQK